MALNEEHVADGGASLHRSTPHLAPQEKKEKSEKSAKRARREESDD